MDFSELTFVVRGASGGGVWEQGGHGVQERGGVRHQGPVATTSSVVGAKAVQGVDSGVG
jgi:hypothetical protein